MNVTDVVNSTHGAELMVTLATFAGATTLENVEGGVAATGGKGHPLAPPGCLTLEQGDFLPWDNPDNIVSRSVSLP